MPFKSILNLIVILGLALAGYLYFKTMKESAEAKRQLANIAALSDSVRVYKTKSDELGAEKLSLQVKSDELKKLNKTLYDELQKEKGNVKVITKTEVQIVTDTLRLDNSLEVDGEIFKLVFSEYKENKGGFRRLEGYTEFKWDNQTLSPFDSKTTITENTLALNLITGVREEDNSLTIFVRTEYPGIEFKNIQGAVLEKNNFSFGQETPKFTVGPQIGIGWTPYGITPYVGIGAQYNVTLFSFLK